MKPNASPSPAFPPPASDREERLRHLPVDARAAFNRFLAKGDPAALDTVLFAILADFAPHAPAQPLAKLPGSTRLAHDLGFDSLALTEVVFFAEDLLGLTITNEEMIQVRTLDDLRGFIHRKLGVRAAR